MNKKEIAQQFTKQMLDPNLPSISFEQVTNMLREIEQTHCKIMSNTEAYRIQHKLMDSSFSARHSQLESLKKEFDNLSAKLKESSTLFSKSQKVSLWQRYWTAILVGIISSIITSLLWVIIL